MPDGSPKLCQFLGHYELPVGAKLTVKYGNAQSEPKQWMDAGYTAESKSDGVFINFGQRKPDGWEYGIFYGTGWYIPFVYRGSSERNKYSNSAWDAKGECQILSAAEAGK